MKVFVLGGYGKVGVPVVKLLAQSDLATEVAVAGRNLKSAQATAAQIGPKAVAVQVDGTDEKALTSALTGYDVVANAASSKSVQPTIRAAAQAGVHYCDVTSFGDLCDKVVELLPEAQAAGITAVIANGIHPSISNLMGANMARQLDEIVQLQIGFSDIIDFERGQELIPQQWYGDPEENLTDIDRCKGFISWMLQIAQNNGGRTACVYHDDRWTEIDPVRAGLDIPALSGGPSTATPYLSSDPLFRSLPQGLGSVPPVEMYFSPLPPQLHKALCSLGLQVLEGKTDAETATETFYGSLKRDPHRWLTAADSFVPVPKLWTRAVGHKERRAARATCWFTAPVWNVGGYYLTSVALVVAVLKILRGEVEERGVMTAETVFDPLSFLDEVASLLPDLDGRMIDESFEWLD